MLSGCADVKMLMFQKVQVVRWHGFKGILSPGLWPLVKVCWYIALSSHTASFLIYIFHFIASFRLLHVGCRCLPSMKWMESRGCRLGSGWWCAAAPGKNSMCVAAMGLSPGRRSSLSLQRAQGSRAMGWRAGSGLYCLLRRKFICKVSFDLSRDVSVGTLGMMARWLWGRCTYKWNQWHSVALNYVTLWVCMYMARRKWENTEFSRNSCMQLQLTVIWSLLYLQYLLAQKSQETQLLAQHISVFRIVDEWHWYQLHIPELKCSYLLNSLLIIVLSYWRVWSSSVCQRCFMSQFLCQHYCGFVSTANSPGTTILLRNGSFDLPVLSKIIQINKNLSCYARNRKSSVTLVLTTRITDLHSLQMDAHYEMCCFALLHLF